MSSTPVSPDQQIQEDDELIALIKWLSDMWQTKRVFLCRPCGERIFHNKEKALETLAMLQISLEIQTC